MIKLQVIGHLGKDGVVKEINGKSVINFNVAHSERFKDAQGVQKDKTIWVECAYWTDKTSIAPYLTKGRTVFVEGTPEADFYSNKEGQVVTVLRMRVQTVQLIGGSNTDNQGANAGNVSHANTIPPVVKTDLQEPPVADDLPF